MDRRSIVQQLVGQIPWGHNIILLTKVKERAEREWYARAAIEYGWSRAVLVHQIESKLCQRQGKAVTNFAGQLPAPQSELAQMTLKDPYMFDFLGIGNEAHKPIPGTVYLSLQYFPYLLISTDGKNSTGYMS